MKVDLIQTRTVITRLLSKRRRIIPTTSGGSFRFQVTSSVKTDENKILKSTYSVPLVKEPLVQFLFKDIHKYSGKTALECALTGKKLTFGQLEELTFRFGSGLARRGVTKDDVIGLMCPNSPDFAVFYLGAVGQGIKVTPINTNYTAHEVRRQLEETSAKMVFTTPELRRTVETAVSETSIEVFSIGDERTEEIMKDSGSLANRTLDLDPSDHVAVLPFSSGTTGRPKGVMLSHSNIAVNILQHIHPEVTDFKEADRMFGILPFYHSYGQCVILLSGIKLGLHVVTFPKFEPNLVIKGLRNFKPNFLHIVPPIVNFLLNNPEVRKEDLLSVRRIYNGAAPLSLSVMRAFLHKCGHKDMRFLSGWGMTELSPCALIEPWKSSVLGRVGTVLPSTEAKVIDLATGEALGPNLPGELCIRGPQVMKGYFKNPDATAATIDKEGWLHSGDVASYDDRGHFAILDRIKDLIKVKGLQVCPAELEDVLMSHACVGDAAVIGIPDAKCGQVPRAFVVLKDKVEERDIFNYVNSKVAPHKKLAGGIKIVDSIPKSAAGKVLRKNLLSDK